MDVQSEEFEVDYSKLKTDVAFMRVNCITRQELIKSWRLWSRG